MAVVVDFEVVVVDEDDVDENVLDFLVLAR